MPYEGARHAAYRFPSQGDATPRPVLANVIKTNTTPSSVAHAHIAVAAKTSAHESERTVLVSLNNGWPQASFGTCRRATHVVHGRPTRTLIRENPANAENTAADIGMGRRLANPPTDLNDTIQA